MKAPDRFPVLRLPSASRRRLLKFAAASGLLAAIERNVALAQTASDYRALVCVNLQGGNDGENMLIRNDAAGYKNYAAVRTVDSGINIAQAQLQSVQPLRGGPAYGFHPSCAPLQGLFNQNKLAVIANVGMIAQASTKGGLESGAAPRPSNLFSHTDQELAVQSGVYTGQERVGWGGRIADRLDGANPGTLFPPLVSVMGLRIFVNGRTSVPLTVPSNPFFALGSSGNKYFQYDVLRDAALREMLLQDFAGNTYTAAAQLYAQEGMSASSVVSPVLQNKASVVSPLFANLDSDISHQLQTIAMLIEGRAQTQMRRQVFYAHQWGYDTHGSQLRVQGALLDDVSKAMKAFQDSMDALGLGKNVTLFTLSEFGRTFKPASNAGTDHGWGNYALVAGGAVRGGDFYGTTPTQALNGPDDFGDAGRWIPTTSIEQYGATLCRWFGIAESDLAYIFPNIAAFANTNLGFMT
jgi:uncharacterized protein (DUF1501 family)